jgi:drug/metabolite transporter (DMT)-like permease
LNNSYLQELFERRAVGESLLLISTFFWGITFIFVKLTLETMPVFVFLTIRFFLATVVTLPLFILNCRRKSISLKNHITKGSVIGAVLWVTYAFQTIGLLYTTATIAAFLTGLSVILTPLLGILLFRSQIQKTIIIGTILAFLGVSLLSGILELDLSQSEGQLQLFGNFLVIICAIAIAFHILLTERFAPSIDPIAFLFFQLLASAILSMGTMFVTLQYDPVLFIPTNWDAIVWITLIITVPFATVFAFFVQCHYQSKEIISSSRIAIIYAFEPVFAAITSLLILEESLSFLGIIGAILIFSAMIISRERNEKTTSLK